VIPSGHVPLTNFDRNNTGTIILESTLPRLTSKPSLSYYRGHRRTRNPNRILESGLAERSSENMPTSLIDVAVASFGNGGANIDSPLLELVIGEDDRVKVSKTCMGLNPWRQICALRIVSQSNRTYVGTGWYIGPGILATAGHCVFLQDDGGWAKSINVITAKYGSEEPFGYQNSKRFGSVDGWVEKRQRDFDYGVIFLEDTTVGKKVGNFAVQSLTNEELKGIDAQISGYPADREAAEFQFFHMRPMIDVTDGRLIYDIDTFGGQSGSPIWQDTVENGLIAVGIHTTGGVSSNSGTRITDDVLDNLIKWSGA
jgi:glutamyl endopeptidase